MKAIVARLTARGSWSLGAKIRPAKTSRFLIHCFGRSETSRGTTANRARTSSVVRAGVAGCGGDAELGAMTAAGTGPPARLAETLERVGLGLEGLEDRQELRDHQEVGDALGQVDELELPALVLHRGEGPDDFAQARAIDVGNVGEIQQDAFL